MREARCCSRFHRLVHISSAALVSSMPLVCPSLPVLQHGEPHRHKKRRGKGHGAGAKPAAGPEAGAPAPAEPEQGGAAAAAAEPAVPPSAFAPAAASSGDERGQAAGEPEPAAADGAVPEERRPARTGTGLTTYFSAHISPLPSTGSEALPPVPEPAANQAGSEGAAAGDALPPSAPPGQHPHVVVQRMTADGQLLPAEGGAAGEAASRSSSSSSIGAGSAGSYSADQSESEEGSEVGGDAVRCCHGRRA